MAERVPVSAEYITPDRPGQARVLLSCPCGAAMDYTFEVVLSGDTESCPCRHCGAVLVFPVRKDRSEKGSGDG